MESILWLLVGLPLAGSAVSGALHFATLRARRASPERTGPTHAGPGALAAPVAIAAMAGAFAIAIAGAVKLSGHTHVLESASYHWIDMGSLQIELSMVLDRLSSVMALVITGVGLLIHVYSAGYMKGDPGYAKFFAYLNLFVAAMMMLVLSSNLLGLFIGWEGVGLCSYLLIGFWYQKGWPAEAGQKAFVVNRIGDASFLIGSFLLVGVFGTLDLSDIGASVGSQLAENGGTLALAALLLFGGCCGKSAQFPLFTWLPDAMAGPTPVSALIHAATMVTAGVYLIARLNPLFAAAPGVGLFIGCIGAFTALIGASTALQQRDIKKVLAYSTVSQLGFMFMALSVNAWSAAVFHLVTHAFFKGLLFLGAGSVIHGMHEEQDMFKMGGLRRHMPKTFATFLAGSAALSGLPLMSGFFSKDEILAYDFSTGGLYLLIWFVGIVAACMTAFYTWRMVALTFFGDERFDPAEVHPHESPATMTVPLMVLAVLAVFGGALNLPAVLGSSSQFLHHWLLPVLEPGEAVVKQIGGALREPTHAQEWVLLALGSVLALMFAHHGFHTYKHGPATDEQLEAEKPELVGFLRDAWRIDSAYSNGIVANVKLCAVLLYSAFDQLILDGAVNGAATAARIAAEKVRRATDGSAKTYALWMATGAAVLTLLWISI